VPRDLGEDIRRFFDELGAVVTVRSVPTRRGLGEMPWLALATVPLAALVKALVGRAAEDAYDHLKTLVGRLRFRRADGSAEHQPPLVLQDPGSRLRIVLEHDLPVDAYRSLVELDLSQFKQGPLHFDRQHSEWRSELDEAARRRTGRG
jgi:hypothetical protein